MPITVLVLTAIAVVTAAGKAGIMNPGPHGFSEILYVFTSQANNNGSAFAGASVNTPFYNFTGGVQCSSDDYWLAVPTLALAGSLVKRNGSVSEGTLPTHTPLFIFWLIAVVLIVARSTFTCPRIGTDRRTFYDDTITYSRKRRKIIEWYANYTAI